MMYVFGQTFSGFIVGSFVTHARTVLYSVYADAPRVWGLSPLDDQVLGGLIMWVIGGVFLLVIYSAVFFAWTHAEGVNDDVAVPIRPRTRRRPLSQPAGTRQALSRVPMPTSGPPVDPAPSVTSPRSPGMFGEPHVVRSPDDRSRLN
jgi:hypothetical protein